MRILSSLSRLSSRAGIAAMWALVVLAVLTIVIGLIAWQSVTSLRQANHRQQQVQALWLARSGIERAAARLLTDSAVYQGESVELISRSEVRIEVKKDAKNANVFTITCEARYPTDERRPVARSMARRFRRSEEKGRVRLEVLALKPI